jgi:hypothetical protein
MHNLVELLSSSWIIRRDDRKGHQGELTAKDEQGFIPHHVYRESLPIFGAG